MRAISAHLRISLISALVLVGIIGSGIWWTPNWVYPDHVLAGVSLMDIQLGKSTQTQAAVLLSNLSDRAKIDPIELQFEGQVWQINPANFDLRVEPDQLAEVAFSVGRRGGFNQRLRENWSAVLGLRQSLSIEDESLYSFDRPALTTALAEVSSAIDQVRRNAVLKMKDDRVTEFSPAQDGRELDVDKTIDLIAGSILSNDRKIDLPVKIIPATTNLAGTNTLGINTLLGHGESDFSGSPSNRRHNISVGADKFDGVIVEPNETFSFIQHLGEVNRATGFLPELVIKGDETVPEFGGGLCQVSTTAFRGILRAGLPIVERRNHSYRVVYYEPAGSDATIYQPYPDLKFTNDTSGHVLIDTYIIGTKLYFDFYGTDTGRTVEMEGPYIFNVTAYPEPIYIDTSTLPVGETKRIDTAHRGADAVLYRKVFQNGKLVKTDTFTSHYVPWPAKYLRGAEDATKVETDPSNISPPVSETDPSLSPSIL
ncbi:MAG: VanW family protein [Patescibacteria group bacterium]|jgi:vancomycin resistance protein YoaR